MVDIFDEVEEDLRAERAQRVLRRYGGLILAAALLVVLGASGWQGWRWFQARQDAAASDTYIAAMTLADGLAPDADAAARAPAIAAFQKVAATAPAGYRSLALLRLAALQAAPGQTGTNQAGTNQTGTNQAGADQAAAAATWNALAADGAADPLLRDLANLMWAQQSVDKGDPALVEARLLPLAAPDNAWHQIAQEYIALLYIRTGRVDQARATLRVLAADLTAPEGLRGRAGGLLDRLGS